MAQHKRKNEGEQVITANRLIDGVVVYWTGSSWSEQLSQSQILSSGSAAEAELEKVEKASVVDVYFFEIELKQKAIMPISERERIRAKGPTVRLDLGKQAEA